MSEIRELKEMMTSAHGVDFDLPLQASQIYLLRLAELDRMIAAIFDYVEHHFGNEAVVVVTADHGMRMPYLSETHKNDEPFLTDIRVDIPLYMRGKDIPEQTYERLCLPNIDLPVMLLQLAGIKFDFDDLDGVSILNSQIRRETVISEYGYAGIYEIAVRGYGYALFLKYRFDDVKFKLLSNNPLYIGLYPLGTNEYPLEGNLAETKPEITEKLCGIAFEHLAKTGIKDNI